MQNPRHAALAFQVRHWELRVNKECKSLCTAVVREVMSAFLSINNRKIITKWKGVVKGAFSMQTIPGSDN